jgi:rhodanese-related sulfurtransferase
MLHQTTINRNAFSRRTPAAARVSVRPSVRVNAESEQKTYQWQNVSGYLRQNNLASISPEDSKARVDSGEWVLCDVRLTEQYDAGHAEGAVSIPMYKTMSFGGSAQQIIKFMLYKSNGVNPVEMSKEFDEDIKKFTDEGKGLIMMCEAGGTMRPSVNFSIGKSSRSLQAAFRAMNLGNIGKVAHADRGLYGWFQADLPIQGDYVPDIGRTPAGASDPTLKNVSEGTGYDMRPDDKPQEVKKKFLGLF